MIIGRRGFIGGLLNSLAAPAVVKAEVLMRIAKEKVYPIREFIGGEWLVCNGAELSKVNYPDLFAALGHTYGGNVWSDKFNIPDLRNTLFPDHMMFAKSSINSQTVVGSLLNLRGVRGYDKR